MTLERVLLYGSTASRQHLADDLRPGDALYRLLVATVHGTDDWRLRVRCLDVLGRAAADAPRGEAEAILSAVLRS